MPANGGGPRWIRTNDTLIKSQVLQAHTLFTARNFEPVADRFGLLGAAMGGIGSDLGATTLNVKTN